MAADLSALDLLVVQIDGLHFGGDLVLVAAIGIDGEGNKYPLALVERATENAATVQALLDNLVSRGLGPTMPRLFIADGAKALSKAIRRTFGSAASAISRADSTSMARRSGQHPRRPRRDPDCRPVEAAEGASSIARLCQHRREHDGHHSSRHAQRQTLAGCWYGLALGRGQHDRGPQELPTKGA